MTDMGFSAFLDERPALRARTLISSCGERPVRKASAVFRMALLAVCAGVGFNLSQRLLDHFLDALVAHETWLAWLK